MQYIIMMCLIVIIILITCVVRLVNTVKRQDLELEMIHKILAKQGEYDAKQNTVAKFSGGLERML